MHRALVKAKLEPYLGFLHSTAYSKPSLVCDFLELYRYLVEDFLIEFCRDSKVGDFVVKSEWASGKKDRKGKRQYLNDAKTREMLKLLNQRFESMVQIPRMRIGNRQTIETLINEEALLLAKFLRDERKTWAPRIADLELASKACIQTWEKSKISLRMYRSTIEGEFWLEKIDRI